MNFQSVKVLPFTFIIVLTRNDFPHAGENFYEKFVVIGGCSCSFILNSYRQALYLRSPSACLMLFSSSFLWMNLSIFA